MPAGGGNGGGIKQSAGVGHGWTNSRIVREDSSDKSTDLAETSRSQLAGISGKFAGFVPVNQFQGERDVSAVLSEAGSFGAITDIQFGVLRALRDGRKRSNRADQRTGD